MVKKLKPFLILIVLALVVAHLIQGSNPLIRGFNPMAILGALGLTMRDMPMVGIGAVAMLVLRR